MLGRRSFLESVAALGVATITPITVKEATGTEIVLLHSKDRLSSEECAHLRETWMKAVKGTSIEHARPIVMGTGIRVELIRK